jgi:hypothetical protein
LSSNAWEDLEDRIVNCAITDCPRNKFKQEGKFKGKRRPGIVFPRNPKTERRVRFVMVSRDPARGLMDTKEIKYPNHYDNVAYTHLIQEFLIKEVSSKGVPDKPGSGVPARANHLFGQEFDPTKDAIYWTHALKCCPEGSDQDIHKDWKRASKYCKEYFEEELRLLGETEYRFITFGDHATRLVLNHEQGRDLNEPIKMKDIMCESKASEMAAAGKKMDQPEKVSKYLHPAFAACHRVKRCKNGVELERIEEDQSKAIKRVLKPKN